MFLRTPCGLLETPLCASAEMTDVQVFSEKKGAAVSLFLHPMRGRWTGSAALEREAPLMGHPVTPLLGGPPARRACDFHLSAEYRSPADYQTPRRCRCRLVRATPGLGTSSLSGQWRQNRRKRHYVRCRERHFDKYALFGYIWVSFSLICPFNNFKHEFLYISLCGHIFWVAIIRYWN